MRTSSLPRLLALAGLICSATLSAQQPPSPAPAPAARPAPAPTPRPAPLPANASKPELVARLVQLQQGMPQAIARALVEQPLIQMQQAAAVAIQSRFPPEAREAAMKDVQAEARKYAEDVSPILREALQRHAAATLGAHFDERFTEEELRQLVAVLESPVLRKYEQTVPDLQRALQEKLVGEVRGRVAERARVLEQAVRRRIDAGPGPAASAPGTAPAGGPARKP